MANYTLDNENKKIIVKMESATDKDMKAIINFQKIGYEITPYVKEKKATNPKYKKDVITEYIEKNGTKEQIKNFYDVQNEIVKGKFLKNGEPKKKGYIAGYKYFKSIFPKYFEE